MKSRFLMLFVVIMFLLPVQAFAAVCFQSVSPGIGEVNKIILIVQGSAEGFFSLVGEAVRQYCGSNQSAPLIGSAHIRSDGKAHFSVFIAGTSTCSPLAISGTLNPPAFNTGSGWIDVLGTPNGDTTTFNPTSCPPLPQTPSEAMPDR